MRYYYLDWETKKVYVYNNLQPDSLYEYVGATDNPNPKMAIAAFFQGESGYSLVMAPSV